MLEQSTSFRGSNVDNEGRHPACRPFLLPRRRSLRVQLGQKLVAAGVPNNPPRWPEATAIVKRILRAYREDAKDWERINDWIDRIGWPTFFELTGLPFTKYHIDNWRGSRKSLNASSYIRL